MLTAARIELSPSTACVSMRRASRGLNSRAASGRSTAGDAVAHLYQALASALGAAASEICLAEEEGRRGNAADKDSQERRKRFEAAAQHYRKGANLTSNREVKVLALTPLPRSMLRICRHSTTPISRSVS